MAADSARHAVLDVHYHGQVARAACVSFADWQDDLPAATHVVEMPVPAAYVPGRFFERELPCLLAVLEACSARHRCLVIDGFVHLEPPRTGLGTRLASALGGRPAVIGVAKNPLRIATRFVPVYRGRSRRPLLVSSINYPLRDAAARVAEMHGPHRVPTLIGLADRTSRSWEGIS